MGIPVSDFEAILHLSYGAALHKVTRLRDGCVNRLGVWQQLPELHNYLVEVDAAAKKATIAGWLFFEQGPDSWR